MHAVGHGGDGIGVSVESASETFMVRGAFPGERVLVTPSGRRGGVSRGRLLKVLERSDQRTEPTCGVADRCGGCPWMAWDLEAQRAQKLQWVRQAVVLQAPTQLQDDLSAGLRLQSADTDGLGYRRTARLAWHRSGQGLTLGYRAAGSQRVVDVSTCPILTDALGAAWKALREGISAHLVGRGEVVLSATVSGVVAELRADPEAQQPGALHGALRALVAAAGESGLCGISLRIGETTANFGQLAATSEGHRGAPLDTGSFGFLQANAAVNAQLARAVVDLARPDGLRVLELYAGHGNFTLGLAALAAEVRAIEVEPTAADAGNRNLAADGRSNARIVTGDVAQLAAGPRVDVVVLDPPRTGAREVLDAIIARRPQRIVYVSCDLPTLRRDLTQLVAADFVIDAVRAFDMFPHTAHVETVVRLTRGDAPQAAP